MTLWDLVRALVRRWPVVLACMVGTAAFGILAIHDDGVYWSRAEVIFLAPTSAMFPNALETRSEDIIITAGVVAKRVVGPDEVLKFASPDVNLIGTSTMREGYWVRLPDSGGQWAPHFKDQLLVVEVVAPTLERASAIQSSVIQRIEDELASIQADADVDLVNRITVTVAPESTVIYQVHGSRTRALAMTALLGAAATIFVVVLLERLGESRRPRPLRPDLPAGRLAPRHAARV
ncbi:hypothetical protein [Cellulomonas sp.]|uniref:hypothetical protein n=1 Tax=Cellulomonas sp. TaxID=40001 RepID=UPI003BAB3449